MDYGTAKTLSLVGLIFIGIQLAIGALIGLIMLLQFIIMGSIASDSGGLDSGGIICLCFLMLIPLACLVVPVINFILAKGLHEKINASALEERDKTRMIWVIVLSFLGGGGIVPGIMYLLIVVGWNDLTNRPIEYHQ